MMLLTREFWEPKKFTERIERKDLKATVYFPVNHDPSKPKILAMGFSGKKAKYDFHYNFESEAKRDEYVSNYFKRLQEILNRKVINKQGQATRTKEFIESLKPGVILYDTWGYEQTNVEFYVIKEVKGSTVWLQELGHVTVPGSEGHDCCRVTPGEAFGPVIKKVVRGQGVKISSCIVLHSYDGKDVYKSWYY